MLPLEKMIVALRGFRSLREILKTNFIEHPELIAEYICNYASIVGRENVIAGADCGFSSRASYAPEVHPTVVWPKFKALAEGAEIASKKLWG